MLDEHPAVEAAEQIVRDHHIMLRSILLGLIREYKRELDDLPDDAPEDMRVMAWGSLRSQVELYRQVLREEPDY